MRLGQAHTDNQWPWLGRGLGSQCPCLQTTLHQGPPWPRHSLQMALLNCYTIPKERGLHVLVQYVRPNLWSPSQSPQTMSPILLDSALWTIHNPLSYQLNPHKQSCSPSDYTVSNHPGHPWDNTDQSRPSRPMVHLIHSSHWIWIDSGTVFSQK